MNHMDHEPEGSPTDDEGTNVEDAPVDADGLLTLLVRVANAGKGEFGVTLWVGGAIVSGKMVGIAEFFEAVADEIEHDTGDSEGMSSVYRQMAAEEREKMPDPDQDSPADDEREPHFIHLKDAGAFVPGAPRLPTNRGVAWRGRLDRVDAWSLGILSVPPATRP